MTLLQSRSFASYGFDDNLLADKQALRQFIGRSSLPLSDQLVILFIRRFSLCDSMKLVRTMPAIPVGTLLNVGS